MGKYDYSFISILITFFVFFVYVFYLIIRKKELNTIFLYILLVLTGISLCLIPNESKIDKGLVVCGVAIFVIMLITKSNTKTGLLMKLGVLFGISYVILFLLLQGHIEISWPWIEAWTSAIKKTGIDWNKILNFLGLASGFCMTTSITNLVFKEDELRKNSKWRESLFLLERQSNYGIADLFSLNSYINPYSKNNKISIIVNKFIVSVIKNDKRSIDNVEENLKYFLKKGKFYNTQHYNAKHKKHYNAKQNGITEIKYEELTIFDLSEDINDASKDVNLTPHNSSVFRLCCHALLKDEWRKFSS